MNPENHGSREACQKLFKEGIVVETDAVWIYARHIPLKGADKFWKLFDRRSLMAIEATQQRPDCIIPALSMAEGWRELPTEALPEAFDGLIRCRFDKTKEEDYLIELLIWVRKEANNEPRP